MISNLYSLSNINFSQRKCQKLFLVGSTSSLGIGCFPGDRHNTGAEACSRAEKSGTVRALKARTIVGIQNDDMYAFIEEIGLLSHIEGSHVEPFVFHVRNLAPRLDVHERIFGRLKI